VPPARIEAARPVFLLPWYSFQPSPGAGTLQGMKRRLRTMRGPLKPEIKAACKAVKDFQNGLQPLFLRVAEDSGSSFAGAKEALTATAVELADDGTLEYLVGSIHELAKERGFKNWKHLLTVGGESVGLKEVLKRCRPKKVMAAKAGQ